MHRLLVGTDMFMHKLPPAWMDRWPAHELWAKEMSKFNLRHRDERSTGDIAQRQCYRFEQ